MTRCLAKFFSGEHFKPPFRLSRNSINMLVQMLPHPKAHGWSHEVEVLVSLLACLWSFRHLQHATYNCLQDHPQCCGGNDDHPPQSYSFPKTRVDGGGGGRHFLKCYINRKLFYHTAGLLGCQKRIFRCIH